MLFFNPVVHILHPQESSGAFSLCIGSLHLEWMQEHQLKSYKKERSHARLYQSNLYHSSAKQRNFTATLNFKATTIFTEGFSIMDFHVFLAVVVTYTVLFSPSVQADSSSLQGRERELEKLLTQLQTSLQQEVSKFLG